MPLPDLVTKYGMDIRGVLHVGAHLVEERDQYEQCHVGPVTWCEANPAVIPTIQETLAAYPNQRIVQALIYSQDGVELDFHVSNYEGMSSSILEWGTHPSFSPDTVWVEHLRLPTMTIDTLTELYDVKANMLVMDIQGAELHALQGARRFMEGVDYVLSEVNDADVYLQCARVEQIDAALAGFDRVETHWVADQKWGDMLAVRRT